MCSQLLVKRTDAGGMQECLNVLAAELQSIDRAGLQACTDYVLFPLLFIVDSVHAFRGVPICTDFASQACEHADATASQCMRALTCLCSSRTRQNAATVCASRK